MEHINNVIYDYIIVGGGLAGCVLASRLAQYRRDAKIIVIEAGRDTRDREDILSMQAINIGGNLDWQYETESSHRIHNRRIVYNQGKGLGGGTAINSGELQQHGILSATYTHYIL